MGNKMVVRFQGRVICTRSNQEHVKSMSLDRKDFVAKQIFGSQRNIDAFLKKNRKIHLVINHGLMSALEGCEKVV